MENTDDLVIFEMIAAFNSDYYDYNFYDGDEITYAMIENTILAHSVIEDSNNLKEIIAEEVDFYISQYCSHEFRNNLEIKLQQANIDVNQSIGLMAYYDKSLEEIESFQIYDSEYMNNQFKIIDVFKAIYYIDLVMKTLTKTPLKNNHRFYEDRKFWKNLAYQLENVNNSERDGVVPHGIKRILEAASSTRAEPEAGHELRDDNKISA
jgi:hypothetical protein